jgi:FMN phosphatase YigB (HAD superfamily)
MIRKIEAILLDIDNTLYSYKEVNQYAMNEVYRYLHKDFGFAIEFLESEFQKARNHIHVTLSNTGSSHNRLLYFQLLCEKLKLDVLEYSLKLYEMYWDAYLMKMELFEGAGEFIEEFSSKICFVTDLTTHIQHRKLIKLGLSNLGCTLVTSEEVGVEKPHPYIFKVALEKMKVSHFNACMVGDSYEKDVQGAILSGVLPILKMNDGNLVLSEESEILVISTFRELREFVCKNS